MINYANYAIAENATGTCTPTARM